MISIQIQNESVIAFLQICFLPQNRYGLTHDCFRLLFDRKYAENALANRQNGLLKIVWFT